VEPGVNVTISRADAAALIGLTANVEAFVRLGDVDVSPVAQAKIQRRLARDLNVDDTTLLPALLDDLTQRLHRAFGGDA
jgi:hypothetical protein